MKFFYNSILFALPLLVAASGKDNRIKLEIEAGYHVIYSYEGLVPPNDLYRLISQGKVGGIAINYLNVNEDLPKYIAKFQEAYKCAPGNRGQALPIITDQEGGGIFQALPGLPDRNQKAIGLDPNPAQAAAEHGRQAAETIKASKIHFNLAPVLDIFRVPGDFMDKNNRSFSDNPEIAATCAVNSIRAQNKVGVIPVPKHFPGLGAATKDDNTDAAPVTLDIPLSELRSKDILPYKRAIDQGQLRAVMFSWAVYPAVDKELPAGLSKKWIQRELRQNLGFDGVTVSETLGAGSLRDFGDLGNRAILGSRAGLDLILVAFGTVPQGESVHKALVDALERGDLDKEDFAQATRRILRLRDRMIEYDY
ncbi:hypothetical protein FQN57_000120 [Myotisia sp. PD_48]|nr:hypothetical protein FQN57_000120 [Myotisia sp. PD_48]